MNVRCVNPQCPEYGVAKALAFELPAGEVIRCGGMTAEGPCAQPCEVIE